MKNEKIEWEREHEGDKVMWGYHEGVMGELLVSFDEGKSYYNLWEDYPQNMTGEEIALFDKENPYWADFFSDRKKAQWSNS